MERDAVCSRTRLVEKARILYRFKKYIKSQTMFMEYLFMVLYWSICKHSTPQWTYIPPQPMLLAHFRIFLDRFNSVKITNSDLHKVLYALGYCIKSNLRLTIIWPMVHGEFVNHIYNYCWIWFTQEGRDTMHPNGASIHERVFRVSLICLVGPNSAKQELK